MAVGARGRRYAAGAALTASQIDILGPLSGILSALPAAAPPPLNMCLMPFTSALAELGLAVRQVRFNKEAAAMLQRRGTEIAQKLQDVVKATQGLPTGTGRGRRSDGHGHRPGARRGGQVPAAVLEEGRVLEALLRLARRAALRPPRQAALRAQHGARLGVDLQQLALQAQRFEKIEGLIQLLGQQTVDANNQAAAQRAAILCGIEKGSAIEQRGALGARPEAGPDRRGREHRHRPERAQQESLDEVKEMVAAKNSKLRGRALARQDKERALEELEIELDSVEEQPFAKGAMSMVHRGKYQGDTVVLKKTSLVGMFAVDRAKLLKAFATELTIMTQLRSPRIVSVIGAVTVDSSYLGLGPRVLRGRNAAGGARR